MKISAGCIKVVSLLLLSVSLAAAQKPYRGAEYRTIASMLYGRFEVRMRSAQVPGMLSSFFTYYDPASPWNEIDIENMGRYTNESQFNTIVPMAGANHVQRQVLPFNPHAAFHVYAIEWTPAYVAWKIDGNEVYRQTGSHIALLTQPQKLMMNIWQPTDVPWAGTFNAAQLPVYAYYDWVKYHAYTPGTGDDFTLQWTDDFTTFDSARWQKATHTWNENNAQFVTENAVLKDGYLVLCLTSNTTNGYAGGSIVDTDVDPPTVIAARAFDSTVVVRFSEPVAAASAENGANYTIGGLSPGNAKLRSDGKTVDLAVPGLNLSSPYMLTVKGIQDMAAAPHVLSPVTVPVVMPLSFPIKIDAGGTGAKGYLADSVWDETRRYGAVGGVAFVRSMYTPISNTSEPEIYRSALHGLLGYKIRIPNGTYKVTLMMAEDRFPNPGTRVFSAKAEGQDVFTNLDLVQQAGLLTAYNAVAPAVTVSDNILDLWFGATADSTLLSGIVVERAGGPTGVLERLERQPDWQLSAYPNPWNPVTTIGYTVGVHGSQFTVHSTDVKLTVYNLLGQEVAVLVNEQQAPGRYQVRFDGTNLSSGIYLCRLSAGSHIESKAMLLVR